MMTSHTYKKIFLVLCTLALMVTLSAAFAYAVADQYTLLEPLPCTAGQPGCENGIVKTIDIEGYLAYLFDLLIGLAGAAAVFMIVWGGFLYMTTDSYTGKSEGITKVKNAVYGLLLVLGSYLLIETVNPRLVIIPSNLVPKITIESWRLKTNSNFFDQLGRDVDSFQARTDEFNSKLEEAVNKTKQEEDKLIALNEQRDFMLNVLPEDDPEIQQLNLQIQASQAIITDQKVRAEVETAKAILTNGVITGTNIELTNAGRDLNRISHITATQKAYISEIRDARIKSITELGRYDSATLDEINEWANYAELYVDIKKVGALTTAYSPNVSSFGSWAPATTQVTKAKMTEELAKAESRLLNVKDEKLRAELQAQVRAAKTIITQKFGPN